MWHAWARGPLGLEQVQTQNPPAWTQSAASLSVSVAELNRVLVGSGVNSYLLQLSLLC